MANAPRDENRIAGLILESSTVAGTPVPAKGVQATGRLLVDFAGGGSGTVTDVSVVSANGFAGSVATSTTTPAITITTSINAPVLAGNGTALSAATTSGTGSTVILQGTPTLTTPVLGVATATSINKVAITAPATNATLTIQEGFTLTVTGNASVSGTHTGTSSGTNTGDQTNITGNAGTVTVADAGADTTTWVLLGTSQTGSLAPATDAGLTYDASTNNLTTTTFTGALSGNATTATTATTATNWTIADEAADTTCFPVFVTAATGNLPGKSNANLTYNASTSALSIGTTAPFTAGTIELGAASDTTLARSAAGQISVEGVQVVTLSNTVTLTNKIISQTVEPATDDTYTGEHITGLNAGATIAQWDCVYLGSASKWLLTDADAASSAGGVMVGMAVAAGTDTNPLTVILRGVVRNDGWTWATVGAPLYLDTTTAGGMTLTAPSATDDVVRIVGYVLTDDCIYFNPSNDWITRV
jgi:hypothetical protein